MGPEGMNERLRFLANRIRERLWFRPAVICIIVIAAISLARVADSWGTGEFVPDISFETLEKLLTVISGSMLVIATFAVSSMVNAYASASNTATPRSFPLVVADDVSQNSLSAFIGAFIFSIISLIAVENSYFARGGRFTLFVLTLLVFSIVILTFVRWVDRIARLGRLGTAIRKVEDVTADSIRRRRRHPHMGGIAVTPRPDETVSVNGQKIGYVQRIDISVLQNYARDLSATIEVGALPGAFVYPGRSLAFIKREDEELMEVDREAISAAFVIGSERTFDDDPRFGLVALSEIASRALSPAVNDPGTAIDVIGSFVRLFALWAKEPEEDENEEPTYDRVEVPELSSDDMFDDAFNAVGRDGAGHLEVVLQIQKALESFAASYEGEIKEAAIRHSRLVLTRAEKALTVKEDLQRARESASFSE